MCAFPEDNQTCHPCKGEGSWPRCMSSPEWCQANPRAGRESVASGTPEWFVESTHQEMR